MKKKKSKFLINFEFIAARLGIVISKTVPLKICYMLSEVCCRILYFCDKRHRVRAVQHILHSG